MRTTTFVTAAFAAVAMAAPFADMKERAEDVDIVTATDVVVVTDVVYVTANGPSPSVVYTTTTVPAYHPHHHHHHHSHPAPPAPPSSSEAPPPSSSEAPPPPSSTQAPAPTSSYVPPSSSVAPAPTSSYVPPAPSSSQVSLWIQSLHNYLSPRALTLHSLNRVFHWRGPAQYTPPSTSSPHKRSTSKPKTDKKISKKPSKKPSPAHAPAHKKQPPKKHTRTVISLRHKTATVTTHVPAHPTPKKNPKSSSINPNAKHATSTNKKKAAPTSSASGPSGSSYPVTPYGASSGSPEYQQVVYNHHNIHRANHSAPAVEWDDGLYQTALKIAQTCYYAHSMDVNGGGYGQNIAAGVQDSEVASVITDLFYNNEVGWFADLDLYGQASPSTDFGNWGHFSQLVWKDTTKVACATVDCTSQGLANLPGSNIPPYFTVCNYSPPGNYAGQYANNIARPLGEATVYGSPNH